MEGSGKCHESHRTVYIMIYNWMHICGYMSHCIIEVHIIFMYNNKCVGLFIYFSWCFQMVGRPDWSTLGYISLQLSWPLIRVSSQKDFAAPRLVLTGIHDFLRHFKNYLFTHRCSRHINAQKRTRVPSEPKFLNIGLAWESGGSHENYYQRFWVGYPFINFIGMGWGKVMNPLKRVYHLVYDQKTFLWELSSIYVHNKNLLFLRVPSLHGWPKPLGFLNQFVSANQFYPVRLQPQGALSRNI